MEAEEQAHCNDHKEDESQVLPNLSVEDSILPEKKNEFPPQIHLTEQKLTIPTNESNLHGKIHHNLMDPAIGLAFETENAAFDCYNEYAKKIGFTVRWDNRTLSRRTGVTLARRFVCSKQGRRGDGQKKRHSQAKYHREETRCGCLAYMKIKLSGDGKYRIIELNTSHNHPLASQINFNYAFGNLVLYNQVPMPSIPRPLQPRPSQVPYNHPVTVFLPIGPQQAQNHHSFGSKNQNSQNTGHVVIMPRISSGETKRKRKSSATACTTTVCGMENDSNASVASDPHVSEKKSYKLTKSDLDALLEFFRSKQAESPSFLYSFQLNAEGQITNAFWIDGKMKTDYDRFGDVVCFDTTYRMNDYGRPITLFTGLNQHKQIIIYGAALVYEETVHSFKWIFSSFLKAVGGRRPTVIFTDDHPSISSELNEVPRRLCAWHVFQHASRNLAKVFTGSKEFEDDFAGCISKHDVDEEFVTSWNSMLAKYDLAENSWLREKFLERERWVPAYGKTVFSGDILGAQLRERMNRELRRHLSSANDMNKFLQGFERVLGERREKEMESNMRMIKSSPTAPPVSMIQQAARVYTGAAFDMFMAEYVAGLECLVRERNSDGSTETVTVEDGHGYKHKVRVNLEEESLICSCCKFDRVGILCGHVLKCIIKRVRSIPERYILRRWTRCAGNLRLVSGEEREGENLSRRYGSLVNDFMRLAARSVEDEEMFACVQRHKEAMAEEMEKVFKEKSSSLSYNLFGEHVW